MGTTGKRFRTRLAAATVGAMVAGSSLAAAPVAAQDAPLFIPWSSLLPGFTIGYEPSSANDCTSGDIACVEAVIQEMQDRFEPLAAGCDHNSMFALTYLRTTEQYLESATTPGFFSDPGFINHQDAVFARYYFEAWDAYRSGDVAGTPRAWQLAFSAADTKKVSGLGNLLLGMSAHVNRDLPLVLAEIGLVKPDGSSRKPDHDKVNEFLNLVMEPLLAEAGAYFDPTVDDVQIKGTTLDETAVVQLLVGWRELAWRNAEALVAAPTPAARQLVLAQIERVAEIEAQLIILATGYSGLNVSSVLSTLSSLGATTSEVLQAQLDRTVNALRGLVGGLFQNPRGVRDAHCQAHR